MLPKSHLLQQHAPFFLQFHVRPSSHPPSLPSPSSCLMCLLSSCIELFCLILLVSHWPYFPILILYPYFLGLICLIFQSLNSILYFFPTFALFSYPYLVSLYSLYHHLYIYNNFLTINSICYIFLCPYLVSIYSLFCLSYFLSLSCSLVLLSCNLVWREFEILLPVIVAMFLFGLKQMTMALIIPMICASRMRF